MRNESKNYVLISKSVDWVIYRTQGDASYPSAFVIFMNLTFSPEMVKYGISNWICTGWLR